MAAHRTDTMSDICNDLRFIGVASHAEIRYPTRRAPCRVGCTPLLPDGDACEDSGG